MPELYFTQLFNDANLQGYYRFEGNSNDAKNSNNGTDTAITYNATNGKYGQGAGFNGTTSKIVLAGITITSNLTFNAWVKVTDNAAIYPIIGGAANSVEARIITSGKIELDKNNVGNIGTSNSSIPVGTWHMTTITFDGTTASFYLDGIPDGTSSNSQTFGSAVIGIGFNSSDNLFYNGALDEVAIFDRVLTSKEILNLFQGYSLIASDI